MGRFACLNVGGKVFAIGGWMTERSLHHIQSLRYRYEVLKDQPGLRPAPYLASRGMKWIQHYAKPGFSDGET